MVRAAEMIHTLSPPTVLLTGGHLESNTVTDVLIHEDGLDCLDAPRIESRHTHGTGCTLASAVATGIAQGMPTIDAVKRARSYLRTAIENAPGYGAGHGPLDHGVTVTPPSV
jgi:hydroxymethylpyrimidine/phosphomethylpyrimidine kinase